MATAWDEIQRLAADLQKVQLTTTLQKLSERNCIEIVTLLLEKKLLELVYTNDGKEYVTFDHLEREVLDELYMSGGRVNLVEVSKNLNVDLSKIEVIFKRIAEADTNIHFMLGQLINEDYITHIAQEINEKLAQKGEISVSELTEQYDLPSDFLQHDVIEKHLGKIIRGRQDPQNPRLFFTQAYIQRCKVKIRGALAALTQPTKVSTILQQINVQEKVFHTLLDEIAPAGQVTTKKADAVYVPQRFAKMQIDYVCSFYKQNGFLEYGAISKLGVSDPKQFITKHLPNEDLMFLNRCAIGAKLIDLTVLSALQECSATKSYVDLSTILPTSIAEEDMEEIFNTIIAQKNLTKDFVYLDGIVLSAQFVEELIAPCQDIAFANAKTAIDSGIYQQYLAERQLAHKPTAAHDYDEDSKADKRDERRKKAASGKTGGGTQGRETKTKSTKKHQRGGRGAASIDSDEEQTARGGGKRNVKTIELVHEEEILKTISKKLEDEGLDHLAQTIANLHLNELNNKAIARAQELYEATPQTNRRQTHAAVQEKINTLIVDIRLYEKGLKHFSGEVQAQLTKYLLKSLGNDICNELTIYIANECNIQLKSTNLNAEQRIKIANECAAEYKNALIELNRALNRSIDDFVLATEETLKTCSMIIKKIDKKKDRQVIIQHKEKLLEQLRTADDSALVLHLVVLVLFTTLKGCILHASGKFVSHIMDLLRANLSAEQDKLLREYHDLVLMYLQAESGSDSAKVLNEKLLNLQTAIKELAQTYEKPGVSKAE